jgi:signal transduction histidine kinase
MLAIERIRLRIASDLHDDIGSTLTKIAIHSEVIQGTDDPEKIRSLSKQIGAASREVIRDLSDIVWSIDARHDTLGNLADRMRDFATEVLTPRHVSVHYEMADTDPGKVLPVEVRQTFYLIFKEAVNNILRHSDARNVRVTLTGGAGLSMSVADDGSGSGKPVHETGHGLRNMRMRAERLGAELRIEAAQGVKVELKMPVL